MRLSCICSILMGLSQTVSSVTVQPVSSLCITKISFTLGFLSFAQTTAAIESAQSSRFSIVPRFGRGSYESGDNDGHDYGGDDGPSFFGRGGPGGATAGDENGFFGEIQEAINLRNAHGIIMSLVMLILLPIGGLMVRVNGKWWLHAGWQMLGAFLLTAGFGIGVYLANDSRMLFDNTHTILGTVVFALFLVVQPVLGFLQHAFFKKNKRRGPAGYMHTWLGRVCFLLGVVNGGLGLRLARQEGSRRTAYIAVAAVMGVLYITTGVMTALLKRRKRPEVVAVADKKVYR